MVKILRKIFILAVILNVVEVAIPFIKKTMTNIKREKRGRKATGQVKKKEKLGIKKLKNLVSQQNEESTECV